MYKLLFVGFTILAVVGYFTYSQNKINKLTKENAQTASVLEGYVEANNLLRSSIAMQADLLEQARNSRQQAEQRAIDALRAFENSDLNFLSQKKPELIERRINEGTRNVLTQIETITRN
jgi:hypothetical protein